MTDLEKALQKRSNITFFREDKVPERLLIEEIIEKAHTLTPHKNNLWHYEIEIYGPESSGKTTLALQVVAEAQKAGGICGFVDAEHALDPVYAK